jgi:hypothetical protein
MRLLLPAVGLFALVAGCLPQAAVSAGKPPRDNVQAASTALGKAGYACERMKDKNVFLCEQEDPKVRFLIGYEEMPPRMVVAMTFTYETECDVGRLKRINLFHDRVDYALAYCEDKAVVFVGSYIIPEHGLTAKDLTGYIRWWTKATLQAGASVGLFEDEGTPGGEKPGKPPISDPANDGTKT